MTKFYPLARIKAIALSHLPSLSGLRTKINIRVYQLIPILTIHLSVKSQSVATSLRNGDAQMFRQHLYVYGLTDSTGSAGLLCYRYDSYLHKKDSAFIPLGKDKAEFYLRLYSDTLHGHLNLYLQKKGQNQVKTIRLAEDLSLTALVEKTEISRLNNSAMLGARPFYAGDIVYSIKTSGDSSGRQFYLNCFKLRDHKQNFDYQLLWQHPFDRKNIGFAKIVSADKSTVHVFTEIESGAKKGQWLLKINAADGALLKGTKLNAKNETLSYLPGVALNDILHKRLILIGECINPLKSAGTAGYHQLYFLELDSFSYVSKRKVFTVPVTETKRGAAKQSPVFNLSFESAARGRTGIEVQTDLYIAEPGQRCFNYCNTVVFRINDQDKNVLFEKNVISSNKAIESWLYMLDKKRMNGQLCTDSLGATYFNHADLPFPVKKGFKKVGPQSVWLLAKTETARGSISFGQTVIENNILAVKPVVTLKKSEFPRLFLLNYSSFVLIHEGADGKLVFEKGTW